MSAHCTKAEIIQPLLELCYNKTSWMSQPAAHLISTGCLSGPQAPHLFLSLLFFNILFGLQAINLQILGPLCALLLARHSAFRMLPRPFRLLDHRAWRLGFRCKKHCGPESTAEATESMGHSKVFCAEGT